ncbi:MAG: DUF4430 domain-containing protein [Candidatus Lokiarchaeota archaeon]|nr:DUF4430 domain-containing protein [Candidatus Lokiarchaeota archaeon]
MDRKKLLYIIISLSLVIGIVITMNIVYFGTDWFQSGGNNHSDYTWASDEHRLTFPETIFNITLEVYYGEANGTIETYQNIALNDHYTTIFDILNACCEVEYEIFWWTHPTFFITSINDVQESDVGQHWWQFEVNGTYIPAGANAYSPGNHSHIRWYLT